MLQSVMVIYNVDQYQYASWCSGLNSSSYSAKVCINCNFLLIQKLYN